MPVSDKGYIHIRIPRNASTSICQVLNNYPSHKTAIRLKEELGNEWNSLFKFTIVRNPFTRFVSMFQRFCDIPFKDFMKTRGFTTDLRYIPQVDYIYQRNKLLIDYVGKFENLGSSWSFICEKIGIENTGLNHLKKSKPPKPVLDKQDREIIKNHYQKDFDCFGYKE